MSIKHETLNNRRLELLVRNVTITTITRLFRRCSGVASGIIIVATILVSGCATAPIGSTQMDPPAAQTGSDSSTTLIIDGHNNAKAAGYYGYLRGVLAEQQGQYDHALAYYGYAISAEPNLIEAYHRAAGLNMRMGRVAQAVDAAEQGLAVSPDNLPLLLLAGGIYASLNQPVRAALNFKRYVELDPEAKEPWIYLAIAHFNAAAYEDALVDLDGFVQRFPGDPVGYYYRGKAYGQLKRWDEAENVFKKLITDFPDYASGYEGLAAVYRMQKKLDPAVAVYKAYLKRDPNDESIRSKLGDTYIEAESYDKAIFEFSELVEREPNAVDLRLKLGLMHYRNAVMTEAEEDYERALEQFQLIRAEAPNNPQALYYVATIFERMGQFEEAIVAWKEILMLGGPEEREIYVKIAQLYERNEQLEASLSYVNKSIALSPEEGALHYFAGLLLGRLNRDKDAAVELEKAVELSPEQDAYLFYLGATYEKLKRYDDCIAVMQKAIALNPEHASALNYLGYIYADQGVHLDEAEVHLKKALALEPDNGYFLDSLAWIYYRQGRFAEALEETLKAVRQIPPDPTIFDHLGDIYQALGDYPAAINAYRKSLAAEPEDKRVVDREPVKKKLDELYKQLEKDKGHR